MVFVRPVTVAVGHSLLGHTVGGLAETLLVTFQALVLAHIFAETMFKVLRRLQAEALARERDILSLNAVMQEREQLRRELHGVGTPSRWDRHRCPEPVGLLAAYCFLFYPTAEAGFFKLVLAE
jgi:hypothetical protein